MSLLVSLANVYEVHKELPHIFLGSTKHFSGTFLGTYRPQMPTNIYLWANERGWMTQDTCAVLLRAIDASLGDLTSRYHVILLMDAHRAHINETICRRAKALNMFLLYVPARLTWLLQPADTHLFAPFKSSIRRTYTNRRLAAHDGRLSRDEWLGVVCEALQDTVMNRQWGRAFGSNGITNHQEDVSMYVREMAGLSRSTYPTQRPSSAEVEYLFGIKNIPYNLLMPDLPVIPPVRVPASEILIPRARRLYSPGEGPADPAVADSQASGSQASHGRGRGGCGSAEGAEAVSSSGRGGRGRGRGRKGGSPSA